MLFWLISSPDTATPPALAAFPGPNKILFSVYATAVLMNLLKRQRDAVGLSTFTHKLDFHSYLRS